MINQYPLWKYLLILAVVLIGVIYALPNIYGEDPAVQISNSRSTPIGASVGTTLAQALKRHGLPYKSIETQQGRLLVRFSDTVTQLKAVDPIKEALGNGYIVALNLAPAAPTWMRAISALPMYLGLDLRGGVYFLLQVDMKAAVQQAAERYVEDLRAHLRGNKVRYLDMLRTGNGVKITFPDAAQRARGKDVIQKDYPNLALADVNGAQSYDLTATLTPQEQQTVREFAVKQNLTTLRNRVNELGVAEPIVQQQGNDRIVVELPGVQDTARAKEILGATATLAFHLVDESHDARAALQTGRVPIGDKIYYERNGTPVLLKQRVILTGDYITDAASGFDQETGGAAVFITLNGQGARMFHDATVNNVGRLLAVVYIELKTETHPVNGKPVKTVKKVESVINVARIREPLGKRFQITGLDSPQEARNLALLLRAGALAAPVQIIEERTIGPSLGQENIDAGVRATVIGFLTVVVFMAFYYRLFGLVADLALFMNLVLVVAVMSILQATLTLPGIAGMVLTVGMAVDANVLINERIREELRNGNTPQASIHAGYERAFSTIADSNITTLIAAGVLFMIGSSTIKGFAVTLSIGIVTSMFTAIMGTRAVINLVYGRRKVSKLSI